MFALYLPAFPFLDYLHTYTILMVLVMIASMPLLKYPPLRNKVPLLWIAMGLFQVVFSMFWAYPNGFYYFPTETTFGLLTLTCGIVLVTFIVLRMQIPRRLLGMGMMLLGCFEFVAFFDSAFKFQNIRQQVPFFELWQFTLPFIAFAVVAVVTVSCGILVIWKHSEVSFLKDPK